MIIANEEVPKLEQNAYRSGDTPLKKKKRSNRQRNRPRNKRNRLQEDNSSPVATSLVSNQLAVAQLYSEISTTITNIKANTIEMPNVQKQEVAGPSIETAEAKSREQIMAEREAKKLAKQAKKVKSAGDAQKPVTNSVAAPTQTPNLKSNLPTNNADALPTTAIAATEAQDKSRDDIKAAREAKKAAKQAAKIVKSVGNNIEQATQKISQLQVSTPVTAPVEKKPALTKVERRAIQEAQRAAKAQAQNQKAQPTAKSAPTIASKAAVTTKTTVPVEKREVTSPSKIKTNASPHKVAAANCEQDCKVKLFSHLDVVKKNVSRFVNDPLLHSSISRLGEQYSKRTIVGSNARCIAFLNALKEVVQDFETPPKKEFTRSLEAAVKHHVDHLHKCRPLAVSVSNAYKQFKNQLLQMPTDKPETDLKELLTHFIDTYIENQIGKAALAISTSLQEKITDGDVLLTFGCSSLIHYICEEAKRRNVDFRVIVVDSRPYLEGQELLRRLTAQGIPCTYVLINAISFVMSEATKVLLGAHALLSNGYVMARTGTAQVALVAHSYNVPVLVCCETHKFSERFQTDAIVYNELGNPDDLVPNEKCCLSNWQTKNKMTPLNLNYDITPPELVTAVVTEVSILPCTSVPVILRIKPEIGY